ncbi:MAG: hypothetical protein JNJ88_14260 [Planctomycetes bacterium]|nr:hypothetical protein [Planctomycetota bacterium]
MKGILLITIPVGLAAAAVGLREGTRPRRMVAQLEGHPAEVSPPPIFLSAARASQQPSAWRVDAEASKAALRPEGDAGSNTCFQIDGTLDLGPEDSILGADLDLRPDRADAFPIHIRIESAPSTPSRVPGPRSALVIASVLHNGELRTGVTSLYLLRVPGGRLHVQMFFDIPQIPISLSPFRWHSILHSTMPGILGLNLQLHSRT